MKIAFITSKSEDYLEDTILRGLRILIGENCIDIPKKNMLYQTLSKNHIDKLHGRGFTMYTSAIDDIRDRELENIDIVLYGKVGSLKDFNSFEINNLVDPSKIWHLDGHDLYGGDNPPLRKIYYDNEYVIGVQKTQCFKRELIEENIENVYPTGFGIPNYHIKQINFKRKIQLVQKTAPHDSLFKKVEDLGGSKHYIFTEEKDYYDDLQNSWIGLTCKKGGWDCMRHYEILASGALLLFKDYNKKPKMCSPIDLPTLSYSSIEELNDLINRLIVNNKPTEEYLHLLKQQRKWLINHGTTISRALHIFNILSSKI